MIGIDIVDLKQARLESNWSRKGYLNKIFTAEEQVLILEHQDPAKIIWLLWSMKEAAYKIWSRETNTRIYAPVKLICGNISLGDATANGTVYCEGHSYFTSTMINEGYISSIAASSKKALKNIRIDINTTGSALNYKSRAPQSVSHHGQYLALAWSGVF